MVYEEIGHKLRAARKLRGYTLEELAHRANMAASFLGQVERGERKLSLATLQRVAAALELEPGSFLDGDGEAPSSGLRARFAALIGRFDSKDLPLLLKLLTVAVKHAARRSGARGPKRSRKTP